MDSFRKSMDLYGFEGHESRLKNFWFVLWITNPDLKRFGLYCDHESSQFSKDSTGFHESNESSQILSTMAQNESLKIKIRKSRILTNPGWQNRKSRLANPDPKDLIRGSFRKTKFPNYSIHFVSEGLVYNFCILSFTALKTEIWIPVETTVDHW